MDVAPFSNGGNTGEFSSSSSVDNLIVRSSYTSNANGLAEAAAGKTVRFKVYANDIKSGDNVRVGLVVLAYYKEPRSNSLPRSA